MDSSLSTFRDKHSTVNEEGKRQWIYAHKPKGKLYTYRTWVSYCYILIFVITPFIKMDGMPLLQFNLPDGEFIFFGYLFTPQDFIVFGICMLIGMLFIIIFTLIYGRIFCGWVCPQTIFMEMIFRKIEYLIEGTAQQQKKSNLASNNPAFNFRKLLKHIIFFVLSFCIANIFLSYIIGVESVLALMKEPPSAHLVGFIAMIVFTLVFYGVYAFMREIVCTVICPYGRLQSVLVDRNSLTVIYDYLRGEPRGKGKSRIKESGDCVDCNMCVNVCPTGIDIRNGTQLECINCTACIDACNTVMHKIGKQRDLIKIDSYNNIEKGKPFRLDYRVKAYSALLLVLIALLTGFLISRKIFDATILRVPGQIVQEQANGMLTNLYRIKITNKRNKTMPYAIFCNDPNVHIQRVGHAIDSLKGRELNEEMFFLIVTKDAVPKRKTDFTILIKSGNKLIDKQKAIFISTL
ncbi:MAG: cytochrome c oxidase accessory protein CcoG [Bacteroidota bacterium]|jgi:cytochrome c oxidase accessory protein FixG